MNIRNIILILVGIAISVILAFIVMMSVKP